MRSITVDINGVDYTARIMAHDEDWQAAALRAVQRRFGRSAAVWRWTIDSRQVDRAGNTVRVGYKGTVVGKENPRRYGGGHPILAEARLWLPAGRA
jgi:hypothetical protein